MDPEIAQGLVDRLLDGEYWLPKIHPDKVYVRLHDDHDGTKTGQIHLVFDRQGDAHVWTDKHFSSMRFRTSMGGGSSLRVRKALLILAEAIRRDNEEHDTLNTS